MGAVALEVHHLLGELADQLLLRGGGPAIKDYLGKSVFQLGRQDLLIDLRARANQAHTHLVLLQEVTLLLSLWGSLIRGLVLLGTGVERLMLS
jgi:hypothetical protein